MLHLEKTLLQVADLYSAAVNERGGKSLARVATIVANRGSFFDPLREGKTCTVSNFERFVLYFRDPAHWPDAVIPAEASAILAGIGQPTAQAA